MMQGSEKVNWIFMSSPLCLVRAVSRDTDRVEILKYQVDGQLWGPQISLLLAVFFQEALSFNDLLQEAETEKRRHSTQGFDSFSHVLHSRYLQMKPCFPFLTFK